MGLQGQGRSNLPVPRKPLHPVAVSEVATLGYPSRQHEPARPKEGAIGDERGRLTMKR
jgi:hypothetical protein